MLSMFTKIVGMARLPFNCRMAMQSHLSIYWPELTLLGSVHCSGWDTTTLAKGQIGSPRILRTWSLNRAKLLNQWPRTQNLTPGFCSNGQRIRESASTRDHGDEIGPHRVSQWLSMSNVKCLTQRPWTENLTNPPILVDMVAEQGNVS